MTHYHTDKIVTTLALVACFLLLQLSDNHPTLTMSTVYIAILASVGSASMQGTYVTRTTENFIYTRAFLQARVFSLSAIRRIQYGESTSVPGFGNALFIEFSVHGAPIYLKFREGLWSRRTLRQLATDLVSVQPDIKLDLAATTLVGNP